MTFINMKQRKQDLTTPKGEYEYIKYDPKTKRYLFEGVDILMPDPMINMQPINNEIFNQKDDTNIQTSDNEPF